MWLTSYAADFLRLKVVKPSLPSKPQHARKRKNMPLIVALKERYVTQYVKYYIVHALDQRVEFLREKRLCTLDAECSSFVCCFCQSARELAVLKVVQEVTDSTGEKL